MSDEINIPVNIPTDENGLIGRECLECKQYFKLKPGTGLPTSHCHCPYCEYEGDAETFWTPAQIEYAKSIAFNEVVDRVIKPSFDKLNNSLKELERKTRNSFIQFKVKTQTDNLRLPIKYYDEMELETNVTCDSCGLKFAVYGVFARCPDCANLNAFLVFNKSIETTIKKLSIFTKPDIPSEITEDSFKHIISDCISAFDALGKELIRKKPELFHGKSKNLFQNLFLLNEGIDDFIQQTHSDYNFLLKMFQVRHLFEHNMGVVDHDFIRKVPGYSSLIGKKYKTDEKEIQNFIGGMKELGEIIEKYFRSN